MSIAVRRLGPNDVASLREIRLEALRLHPENFAADLDEEAAMSPEQWIARLATAITFGGFSGGELNGIVIFAKSSRRKTEHTGDMGSMYVRDAARGTGLADALVAALIEGAAGEVEQVKLTVNAENARAIKFYERHGFRCIGKYPNSLRVGGRTYEELIMLRKISASG